MLPYNVFLHFIAVLGIVFHNPFDDTPPSLGVKRYEAFSFPFTDSLPHRIGLPVVNNACYVIGDFCKILCEMFPKSDYLSCTL